MDQLLKKGAVLIETYKRVRKEQDSSLSRLRSARRGLPINVIRDLEDLIYFPFDKIINNLEDEIANTMQLIPVYNSFLYKIKGLNIYDALEILVLIRDVKRFKNISKLWAYAGLAPIEYCKVCGKRMKAKVNYCKCVSPEIVMMTERKRNGGQVSYNERLKKKLNQVFNIVIDTDEYYKDKYSEYKIHEFAKEDRITALHAKNRAKRKVIKLFLNHLFIEWAKCDDIKKPRPYQPLSDFKEAEDE